MNLIRSKERVNSHGEVFTPTNICLDIIALIPDENWSDPTMICLEPTCGNGQFIAEIIKKKIKSGLSIDDACNTTFGMDIMDDNIKETRHRIFSICDLEISKMNLNKRCRSNLVLKITYIVCNNIFKVNDSIEYIESGRWNSKNFFSIDPNNKGQVLTALERLEIINEAKLFLKRT
jgi:hypothetical protein